MFNVAWNPHVGRSAFGELGSGAVQLRSWGRCPAGPLIVWWWRLTAAEASGNRHRLPFLKATAYLPTWARTHCGHRKMICDQRICRFGKDWGIRRRKESVIKGQWNREEERRKIKATLLWIIHSPRSYHVLFIAVQMILISHPFKCLAGFVFFFPSFSYNAISSLSPRRCVGEWVGGWPVLEHSLLQTDGRKMTSKLSHEVGYVCICAMHSSTCAEKKM